jgi:Zn-dependent peptidase ImmA (M78 family)
VRFTLAHELGHHLLEDPREVIEEGQREMFADTNTERRANAFAGHFLMPEKGVRSVLEWLGGESGAVTERAVVALMEHFGVSMAALIYQLNIIGVLDYEAGQQLRARGVASLVEKHRDIAPSLAGTVVGRVRRPPERLTRQALAAARGQRLGLSVLASLLERDDDEQLWSDVMAGHLPATAASTDIVL